MGTLTQALINYMVHLHVLGIRHYANSGNLHNEFLLLPQLPSCCILFNNEEKYKTITFEPHDFTAGYLKHLVSKIWKVFMLR